MLLDVDRLGRCWSADSKLEKLDSTMGPKPPSGGQGREVVAVAANIKYHSLQPDSGRSGLLLVIGFLPLMGHRKSNQGHGRSGPASTEAATPQCGGPVKV